MGVMNTCIEVYIAIAHHFEWKRRGETVKIRCLSNCSRTKIVLKVKLSSLSIL